MPTGVDQKILIQERDNGGTTTGAHPVFIAEGFGGFSP